MKTRTSQRSLIVILVLITLAATPDALRAGDRTYGYDFEIVDGVLLKNGPKGGGAQASLKNVVDVLRDKYQNANIVMAPGLGDVSISDLKLRAGSINQDLDAIRVASGNKFIWEESGGGAFPAMNPTTGLPEAASGSDVRLYVLTPAPATESNARTVEVFNLQPYFVMAKQEPEHAMHAKKDDLVDQIKAIIDSTIDALQEGKPGAAAHPSYSFHSGAGLLVVVGTRDQIEVARKVLRAVLNPTDVGNSSDHLNGFPIQNNLGQGQNPFGGGFGGSGSGGVGRQIQPSPPQNPAAPGPEPGRP